MSLTIKNYKSGEEWSHSYKEFRIFEITETETEYCFRVSYNLTPYIIKIFRQITMANECEIVLRDGADTTQYGREWINVRKLKSKELTALIFESLIVKHKPKAQGINNPFYSNGPF